MEKLPKKIKVILCGGTGKFGTFFSHSYASHYDIIGIARKKPSDLSLYSDFIEADVNDDPENLLKRLKEKHGYIHVLINNAFFINQEIIGEKDLSLAKHEIETNVLAPYVWTQAMYRIFWRTRDPKENKSAIVINMASIAGIRFYSNGGGYGFYSASKAALIMLMAHVGKELQTQGIRIHTLAPARFESIVPLKVLAQQVSDLIGNNNSSKIRTLYQKKSLGTVLPVDWYEV